MSVNPPRAFAEVVAESTPAAPYATVEDLQARLGGKPLDDAKRLRAEALLHDASTIIRTVAGGGFEEPVPEIVATVCLNMAVRAYHNPEGVRQQSLGQLSTTFASADTGVAITDEERRLIRSAAGHGVALSSIQLTTGYDAVETVLVPVAGGVDPLPWLTR